MLFRRASIKWSRGAYINDARIGRPAEKGHRIPCRVIARAAPGGRRMSSKPGKRARAKAPPADQLKQELALLADQLEQRLLGFPPLMKFLQAVGVDPTSPDARRLVIFMLAGLCDGITRIEIRPRQAVPSAKKWTQDHGIALMLEVVDLLTQGISEREAIKRIAAEPRDNHPSLAHRFPYEPQAGRSEAGRRSSQSTPQERYEEALRQRWNKIKHDEKAQTIVALPDKLLIALGFRPRTSERGEN
jgi:hypothetical protein